MAKNKYSAEELNEFKEIMLIKLQQSREVLEELKEDVKGNKNGTDDTGRSFAILENGFDCTTKEEKNELASRQLKFQEQLERALIRIENGTYGVCIVTGKLIPKERLRIVPHATQSMEAKTII